MSQDLILGLPIPVALALAALVLGVLGLVRLLAALGKPAPLRIPHEDHDPAHSAALEHQPH